VPGVVVDWRRGCLGDRRRGCLEAGDASQVVQPVVQQLVVAVPVADAGACW